MEIKFLGTGGAFDHAYGNSAAWVTLGGKHLLVDCGNTVYHALRKTNLADHIDYLLITHLHDDHVGSLCTTILHHRYLLDSPRKARLLVPDGDFRDQLYEFLRFGLIRPERYVDFLPLDTVPGLEEVNTYGLHVADMQSYGFIFEDEQEIVAYSGDLGDPNLMFRHLAARPSNKPIRVFHELAFDQTEGIHTYYRDLVPHLEQYRIWGYHIDPTQNPADNPVPLVAHQPGLLIGGMIHKA